MLKKLKLIIITSSLILNHAICIAGTTTLSTAANTELAKAQIAINDLKTKVQTTIDSEKVALKSGAEDIVTGYLFSTISLFASTLVGFQVFMYCMDQPSAKVYFMTSTIYIAREIANFKSFKASALGNIKVVDNVAINQNATVNDNVNMVKGKVSEQMGYLKEYKLTLDNGFKAIKNKASNAKLASIGFAAASATAIAEQLNYFTSTGGECLAAKTSLFNKNSSLDKYYSIQIEQALKMEDRWALYSEWEMIKTGKSIGPTLDDYKNYKKNYPELNSTFFVSAIEAISNLVMAKSQAATEVVLNKDLKDNKSADYAGDLDKLGIAGAAAIILVAYIADWQPAFFKTLTASGTSRAIIFGAQSALAIMASKKFDDGANIYIERLNKVDAILNQMGSAIQTGLDQLIISDYTSAQVESILKKVGVNLPKAINQMTILETTTFLESNNSNPKLSATDQETILNYVTTLKNKANSYDQNLKIQ